jgi:hypothetical protein
MEQMEDDDMIISITNSPRSGTCGYEGESDIWTFDSDKSFPQPIKSKGKRIPIWRPSDDVLPEDKWNRISLSNQKKILDNVFCSKCMVTTIIDYTIENSSYDIVLRFERV